MAIVIDGVMAQNKNKEKRLTDTITKKDAEIASLKQVILELTASLGIAREQIVTLTAEAKSLRSRLFRRAVKQNQARRKTSPPADEVAPC